MATKNTIERINFATSKLGTDYPDFLDIQVKSFQDFFQLETKSDERGNEGLYNTFMENFPITDTRNNFVLEFLDYFVDPPRYTIQECIERGLTYSVPLKARLKLYCTDVPVVIPDIIAPAEVVPVVVPVVVMLSAPVS